MMRMRERWAVWQSDGDDAGGSFITCLEMGKETGENGKKKEMTENNGEFNGR